MNGGLESALEYIAPDDEDARWDALMALDDATRARLERLDDEYTNTATGELLTHVFETHYHAHPEDFAPLEPG